MHVFRVLEETVIPGENPYRHMENIKGDKTVAAYLVLHSKPTSVKSLFMRNVFHQILSALISATKEDMVRQMTGGLRTGMIR